MGAAHRYWEFPRRLSRIQNPSTVGLISDGQVPHAPTGSAGDDVRRRHAPSSNVLGIAGQNHGVSIEGYHGDVPVDHSRARGLPRPARLWNCLTVGPRTSWSL